MENKEIAEQFGLIAELLKLKKESVFRIRSYENAFANLRKLPDALCQMEKEQLMTIEGIGETIATKILTLCSEGKLLQLEKLKKEIPSGVVDMLNVRGLGTTKIRYLWLEQNVLSVEDLLQKCKDKTVLNWKGFGEKTRVKLISEIEYYLASKRQMLYSEAMKVHDSLFGILKDFTEEILLSGDLRRNMPVVSEILWLVIAPRKEFFEYLNTAGEVEQTRDNVHVNLAGIKIPLHIIIVDRDDREEVLFKTTGGRLIEELQIGWEKSAEISFAEAKLPYVLPEMRDLPAQYIDKNLNNNDLIRTEDIKGVIHAHTDWSDGKNTIEEMANGAREKGYSYLSVTDHSKAAFYANGLDEKRLALQREKIDEINKQIDDFTVIAGVECDILSDGSMDLSNECLSELDIVIASVHSNLTMGKTQATERLLAAIEHPHVHILGHMSGRLLLSRKGYDLDYEQIIMACSQNNVAIEINANPLRLDIDWKYLPLCRKYGVPICINPDAHNVNQIDLIKYGVKIARKGGILASECINSLDIKQFLHVIH